MNIWSFPPEHSDFSTLHRYFLTPLFVLTLNVVFFFSIFLLNFNAFLFQQHLPVIVLSSLSLSSFVYPLFSLHYLHFSNCLSFPSPSSLPSTSPSLVQAMKEHDEERGLKRDVAFSMCINVDVNKTRVGTITLCKLANNATGTL